MNLKWQLSFLFLVFYFYSAMAQDISRKVGGVNATINGITIDVEFFSPRIVRVVKAPSGTIFRKSSLSVIKSPEAVRPEMDRIGDTFYLKTSDLTVKIDLVSGKVMFADTKGVLFSEKSYGIQFTPLNDAGKGKFDVRQAFFLGEGEVIYGLGQQQNGKLDQRSQKLYLRQDNTRVCIPFFQSVKGYGLFWDNTSPTIFTDNRQETSFDSEVGDCSDYYFMYGGSTDGVVAQMRELTGQAPMMPLWTYGFLQSRERYKTQSELVEVVKKYRSLKVPLDGIVQDWQYWGKDSNWNAMAFDPATFPDPKAMIDSVHNLKAHIFIVAWPGFGPLTRQYAELRQKGMLIDFETWPPKSGTKPYDVYNPVARDIYWRYLDTGIFSLGADAWWLDSSEPDHINLKEKDFDLPTYLGTFRSVRNAFPLEHVGGVYDHQRAKTSDKRVSILTRSAFAGQQRYGANTWSGDVRSDWGTFGKQIPAALNFSMSGIPYWNADIGGFFAGAFVKNGGAKNPDFQELYTRWLQFATFTPLMRSHGTDIPREIYQFGQRGDTIFNVLEKFIRLRYGLLPYSYSTARDVTANAGSFMRVLYADFPLDEKTSRIGDEYMYGKSFLVSPVTTKGAKSWPVYLPSGSSWYDFWTNERFDGGSIVNRPTPIDVLPLYVRAGSIIPIGPDVQYAEEKKWDLLQIRVYPYADGDFTLYEDENDNYNYENGNYSKITFHWNNTEKKMTVGKLEGHFKGMMKKRKFEIVMVGADISAKPIHSKTIKTVTYDGKGIVVQF